MTLTIFRHPAVRGVVALTLLMLLSFILAPLLPSGIDWATVFRPAARELLSLRSPYDVSGFYYPTWALLPMLPLALLPEAVGRAAFFLISAAGFGYAAYRMGASPIALGAFLLSPPVLHCLLNANLDWMVLLGFILPPPLGLFFIAVKPQMSFILAIYWLIEAWRASGPRRVFDVFWPATTAMLITFLLFGLWPLEFERTLSFWWNASLWPMSIPVGLVLTIAAIRQRQANYAIAASPCLSPYVLLHSWVGALITLARSDLYMLAAVIGLWLLVLIQSGILGK